MFWFSLPYSLSGSSLSKDSQGDGYEMVFDSTGDPSSGSLGAVSFSDELTVSLAKGSAPQVSGEYLDKLTFSYSCSTAQRLTLDANGGQVKGSSTYGLSKKVGVSYRSLPTPQWEGHVFEGWYTAASGGTRVASDDVMPSQATTLYAHWRACVLTVNYHNDGAKYVEMDGVNNPVEGQDVTYFLKETYGESFTNGVSGLFDAWRWHRTGYTANGGVWKKGKNGVGKYAVNVGFDTAEDCAEYLEVLDDFKKGDVAVDLYPVWMANSYTVSYDKNGESVSGSMDDSEYTYGTDGRLRLNRFSKSGYEFIGWNTASDGSGASYSDGETVRNLIDKGKVTLYAQWRKMSDGTQQADSNDDLGNSVVASDDMGVNQGAAVDSVDASAGDQDDAGDQSNAGGSQVEAADKSGDLALVDDNPTVLD